MARKGTASKRPKVAVRTKREATKPRKTKKKPSTKVKPSVKVLTEEDKRGRRKKASKTTRAKTKHATPAAKKRRTTVRRGPRKGSVAGSIEYLQQREPRAILSFLIDNPNSTFRTLIERADIEGSPHTISSHLNQLIKMGLIAREQRGSASRLRVVAPRSVAKELVGRRRPFGFLGGSR